MKVRGILVAIAIATLSLVSCKNGPRLMPSISGKAGEVVVVINKGHWESDPGIALRSILAIDQPFLPQREPIFTLINRPENAFTSVVQVHRYIVIVSIKEGFNATKIDYQENV